MFQRTIVSVDVTSNLKNIFVKPQVVGYWVRASESRTTRERPKSYPSARRKFFVNEHFGFFKV